ncbi:MAG: GNAT family N-acetyltransferase [Huintestinicola sp.]
MQTEIRKMQPQDYKKVYSLWLSCSGMGLNDMDDSEEGIAKFLQRNPDTCFVAVNGTQIAGVILVGSDGRRGYIYHTAVHPDFRHNGIGRRLVEKALSALEDIGINKAALVVFRHNENGNEFWEKLGFTVRDDLTYRNKALAEMRRIDT